MICGAVAFAFRGRCSREPNSKPSSPSSHGFSNPAYELDHKYEEVGGSNTERGDASNYELCSFISDIRTGDKVVDIPNDKPSTRRDNRSFTNTKAEPNQYGIE